VTAPLKIAIVGSGIAGLSAAWLLARKHEVTLFERHAAPGMGAFNLSLPGASGETRIDVPLRVFKSVYYANLMALYREAGVAMQPTDHAAAYTSGENGETYFRYRNLRLGRLSMPLLSSLGRGSWPVTRDALRFMFSAPRDRARGGAQGLTIQQYLVRRGYGTAFIDGMLLPSFAAICTCSYDAVRAYPAETIIDFFSSGSLLSGTWRARHGADDAIRRLMAPCAQLHCDSEVSQLLVDGDRIRVREGNGREQAFDHVVLAVQANQAGQLIAAHEAEVSALLRRVPYESSEVVVHQDAALVPATARGASPVSFVVDARHDKPMASICLNRIIPSLAGEPPVWQTWNPLMEPRAGSVLGRARFERPLVTLDSQAAMAELAGMQRDQARRVWFCGSYAMPGIPLLESAVQSAMLIARRLGTPAPWA
jgi:predicted NAD/FAD-binding protein